MKTYIYIYIYGGVAAGAKSYMSIYIYIYIRGSSNVAQLNGPLRHAEVIACMCLFLSSQYLQN
jgi:hypothetical protein